MDSGGGKEVWRRGCELETADTVEGFRLLKAPGPVFRDGRFRGFVMGETCEYRDVFGGEDMVELVD